MQRAMITAVPPFLVLWAFNAGKTGPPTAFARSAVQLGSYLPFAHTWIAFQPVSHPLCQRCERTPLRLSCSNYYAPVDGGFLI